MAEAMDHSGRPRRWPQTVYLFEQQAWAMRGCGELARRLKTGTVPESCAGGLPGKMACRYTLPKGLKALEDFLSTKGVENINAVGLALGRDTLV